MNAKTDRIDEVAFAQGREVFERGLPLRGIIEAVMASDSGSPADEVKALSYALGFADALVERLRRPLVAMEVSAVRATNGERIALEPVATVINNNQPGNTAIIQVLADPPTLGVGTKLFALKG